MKLTKIGETKQTRESGSVYYTAKRHTEEGDIVALFERIYNITLKENELSSDEELSDYILNLPIVVIEENGFTFPFHAKGARCHCEHDCCGHTFLQAASIVGYDPITEEFIIKQSWGLNV